MRQIRFAHVKGFQTVYEKNDVSKPKWVQVQLQVIVSDQREAEEVCAELAAHMDTPLPRFLVLAEQPFEVVSKPTKPKRRTNAK
jgi:hypothetical protein